VIANPLPSVPAREGGDKLSDNAADLSASIVDYAESAKVIIREIQTGLVRSDPKPLIRYLGQLKDLHERLKQLLRVGSPTVAGSTIEMDDLQRAG